MRDSKMLKLEPPKWGLIYLILAFIVSYFSPAGTIIYVPFNLLAAALIVGGVGLTGAAASLFAKEQTEIMPTSAANRKFITYGPYRITRNPMYLGMVLILTGIAFLVGALAMFIAPIALFVTINNVFIPFEEAKMERQYGAQFREYKERVRRWL